MADAPTDFRICSTNYDSDMDIVENFVKVNSGQANKEEQKGLQLYYISRIYNYFGKFKEFVDKHHEILEELNSDQELRDVIVKLGLGEKKISVREDVPHISDLTFNKILSSKGYYGYLIDSDRANRFLDIYDQKDKIYNFVQDKIDDLEREYDYHKVREIFSTIGLLYCLSEDSKDIYTQDLKLENCTNCCLLPNDSGLFGLNTYLYAYFHGVWLIGVPAGYQSFDDSVDECMGNFIKHDLRHTELIERHRKIHSTFKSVYFDIIRDQEATVLQKELFCLVIWVLIHEAQPEACKVLTYNGELFVSKALILIFESLKREFYDEFIKFRDLALVPEAFNSLLMVLPHRKIFKMEDAFKYLDSDIDLIKRSEVMMMFIFTYARLYFFKYYPSAAKQIKV